MRLRNLRFLLLFSVIACGGSGGGGGGGGSPTGPVTPPTPVLTLNQPQSHTNELAVTISGSTAANATLQISGGAAVVTATASASGTFNASVTLKANQENQISVVATNSAGGSSAGAVVTVVHDDIAPEAPTPTVGRYAGADPFPFTGTTEAGAEVTLTSAIDSVQTTADTNGNFEQEIRLVPEAVNEITLVAQDLAGNQGSQYVAEIISDTLPPTVEFHQGDDDDEDGRANISFIAGDECTLCEHYPGPQNAVDLTSFFLANDRAIGGGSELGGIDAGENMLESVDLAPVTEISVDTGELLVAYEVGLAYEFPSGVNVLTITVADSAGNTSTDDIEFNVLPEYGAPSLTLYSGHDYNGFVINSEMYDTGGMLNCSRDAPVFGVPIGCPGLNVVADQKLMALLKSDGTKGDDVAAGENFGHLFTFKEIVTDSSGFVNKYGNFSHHWGEALFRPGLSGAYVFFDAARDLGGDSVTVQITGYVTDRAGNWYEAPTHPALVPATPSSIFILNSSATPGDQAHVVPVGLTNFQPLRGVEFVLTFDPDVMTVDSVKSTGRVPFSPFYDVSGDRMLSVVLVDLAGNLIPVGSDTMAHIFTSIKASAPSTEMLLKMEIVEAADADGNPVVVKMGSGTLLIP